MSNRRIASQAPAARLETIALKAGCLRLSGGDPLLPCAVRELLAGLDAGRNDHRRGRWQYAGIAVIDDVDVVAADQHGRRALNAFEPLFRIEPGDGRRGAGKPLEDDPVRLCGRARRHHGLFDEAGKLRDRVAGLRLPASERIHALRTHPRLRHNGDRALGAVLGGGELRIAGRALGCAHGCSASLLKMRSGVNGRCGKRTPVAFASAFAMAGATGLIAHSP